MPTTPPRESIVDVSRDFFDAVVKPILARDFPAELGQAAIGLFGHGSEALGLDDELSSDHHWGLRIDMLLPDALYRARAEEIKRVVGANLPATWRGHTLREAHVAGAGLAPESLEHFLTRTVGLDHAPRSDAEWLGIPEEDIIHVINGEVWHDPTGRFTAIRRTFAGYYPEPVRLRRIAHWSRFFSGMGTYALKRALLRGNEFYATTRFSNALRLGIQLAFLLDKQYFPYDKWLMAYLARLPRLGASLVPIVEEAVRLSTPWERKLDLIHDVADALDAAMVADGIIRPHPPWREHPTSGYRLLEHAYAEILQGLPPELVSIVPIWDQMHMERFHSEFVASLDLDTWDAMLCLAPDQPQEHAP
jgi:hypothetical protein